MHPIRFRTPGVRVRPLSRARILSATTATAILLLAGGVAAEAPEAAAQEPYKLTVGTTPPPTGLAPAIIEHVAAEPFTVLTADDEPLMDLWFARELPEPTPPDGHPGIAYGTLNEGVVLAVMRLHREHNDYRDQPVSPGVYVARYLRQPDDGNHLGETTYRDYAVLVEPTASSPGPQSYEDTLDDSLALNLHPFAWGLWPANQVMTDAVPGIASFQPEKWAVKLTIPRADGSTAEIAFVVAGNEWHY